MASLANCNLKRSFDEIPERAQKPQLDTKKLGEKGIRDVKP